MAGTKAEAEATTAAKQKTVFMVQEGEKVIELLPSDAKSVIMPAWRDTPWFTDRICRQTSVNSRRTADNARL